jgi:four helix bundle protein
MAKGYGRKTTVDYIRILYISYGSVCELETQKLLAAVRLRGSRQGDLATALDVK